MMSMASATSTHDRVLLEEGVIKVFSDCNDTTRMKRPALSDCNLLLAYQGPASSKPAASHGGAAAGDAINLRNSIAAEGDALLAGTPASYVMYACTAAGTGPSKTTPLALGISLTL